MSPSKPTRRLSLRTQVVIIVIILTLGLAGSVVYTTEMIEQTEENLVRLKRERLADLVAELTQRHSSLINFLAWETFADSTVGRLGVVTALEGIEREELQSYPKVVAGFFHAVWNRNAVAVGADDAQEMPDRFLMVLIQNSLEQKQGQWARFESSQRPLIAVTEPVYSKDRLVGVTWAYDDLEGEIPAMWETGFTPLIPLTLLTGFILAAYFVIRLRKDVSAIQEGLATMKKDLRKRLPVSKTELGSITSSINGLAETILREQEEKEALRATMEQQDRLAALGKLVAGVAHEIRTPLAMVKTRIQLWQRRPKQGKRSSPTVRASAITGESMGLVVNELNRMEDILQKLQQFSKARRLKSRPVDIQKLLDETLAIMKPRMQKSRAKLKRTYRIPGRMIEADPLEMKEVFLNVISNSIEAMPRGGTLTLTTGENEKGTISVAVEDTGPGVSQQHVSKIFDPFFSTKETGMGLGLSIAYEIVRAHGGNLEYSPKGSGARFVVLLPKRQKVSSQ